MDVTKLKEQVSKQFPDMEMTNRRQILSFTTDLTKDNDEYARSGELLFCWPYFWVDDPEIYRPLVQGLANHIRERFHRRNKNFNSPMFSSDENMFSLLSSPRVWREEALTSTSSPGYTKLILWTTFLVISFELDDVAENWRIKKDHKEFVQTLARLFYSMYTLKFESLEELQQNLDYQYLVKAEESFETLLPVLFDLLDDFKSVLELTPRLLDPSRTVLVPRTDSSSKGEPESVKADREETMKYWGRAARYWLQLQTWMDSSEYTHVLEKDLQAELRSWTGGLDYCFEFLFLLDGIIVPEIVRINFYWDRCLRLFRKVIILNNDIFSAKKEMIELSQTHGRLDTSILISMEVENLSLQEALTKCVEAHNHVLNDYRKECKFALENDAIKFELSEEEKIVFDVSLKNIARCYGPIVQEHLLMSRYRNDDLQVTFKDLPPFDD